MIRLATENDLPELVRLGEGFHSQMVYNTHPFDADVFEGSLRGYLEAENFAVWIGDQALAVAMIGTHPATGRLMASEVMLYSESAGQGLKLLRKMADWAKDAGAGELILTDQVNMRDLATLYSRIGAKPVERVYRVELV
jgi:GNAT superfamily N-acetyltransferase